MSLEIEIPLYLEEFRVSNSKRRTPFKFKPDSLGRGADLEGIPHKYLNEQKTDLADGYSWRSNKLYDKANKCFVAKNAGTVGKPRYQPISGNDVWAKMHEWVRIKMVHQLSESFKKPISDKKGELITLFALAPVLVSAEIHTTPKLCDWDLSNLWVYNKVFEDTMKSEGAIPDDCVLYITKPASFRFIPITPQEKRKMVFKFELDNHDKILAHVMFDRRPKQVEFLNKARFEAWYNPEKLLRLLLTKSGDTGSVLIDINKAEVTINVGKKGILASRATETLTTVYWEAINQNRWIVMGNEDYETIKSFVKKNLLDRGMKVYIYERQVNNS